MKKVVPAVLLTGACAVLADEDGIYVGADIGDIPPLCFFDFPRVH